ncbi:MAG: hypothetical protein R8J85_05325 [Mariprofundales bacterium]
MLSDAALASVLINSYRAKLLLPQLKPPVNTVSQANRDAAARAEDQQNADKQQSAVNNAKQADSQRLTAAALDRAATLQRQIVSAPAPKVQVSEDRVTISRVSEIAQQTLEDAQRPLQPSVVADFVPSEPPKVVYAPSDVVKRTEPVEVLPSAPSTLVAKEVSPAVVTPSSAVAAQQYQRNALLASSSSLSVGGGASTSGSASSGVSVRA